MKKTKDVAIICQFFYPEYVSSAIYPYQTAMALSNAGYSVGAYVGFPKDYVKRGDREAGLPLYEKVGSVEIHRLGYIQSARRGFISRIVNYLSFFTVSLFNVFRLRRYRVIMAYTNPPILPLVGVIAKRLFGCRLVFMSYDVYPEIAINSNSLKKNGIPVKLISFTNRCVFKTADHVVAVSLDMEKYLRENRPIPTGCGVTTIPNWETDCHEGILASSEKKPDFIKDGDFVVSYLGNLGICQHEGILLDVIDRLKNEKNIKFVFAGHGNKLPHFKKKIASMGVENVYFLPYLHGEDFYGVLAHTNLTVVSLIDGLLGLCAPSKAYTYMMAGLPIACVMHPESEIGSDVLVDNCGRCFSCNDGKGLAEFVLELKGNPRLCRSMEKASREVFLKKYEKNLCLDKYVELMGQILQNCERD